MRLSPLTARYAILLAAIPLCQTRIATAQMVKTPHYDISISGNTTDAQPKTRGGLQLEGGGTDQPDAFKWLIEHAGGGDIIVIRASGTDAYNPFITRQGPTNSVTTIVFHDRQASADTAVINRLKRAEAVFMAGGDQGNYVEYWKDTPVQETINALAKRGVPIGGTSAGLAVMGQFGFSALGPTRSSITSPEALANPYSEKNSIEGNFLSLPNMGGIITDSHFAARDRMGRTLVFLARLLQDGRATPARSIAVDQGAAVLVEEDGSAKVVGSANANAYFISVSRKPEVCQPNTPLTMNGIAVHKVAPGGTFNVKSWTGVGGVSYTLTVANGVVTSSRGEIY